MKYTQMYDLKYSSRIFCFMLFILSFSNGMKAQDFEALDISFEVNGNDLDIPLIGGLLSPQFISFDLDQSGAEDLIVFERNGEQLLTFINNSTPGNPSYQYAPEYISKFPPLLNFLIAEDFNGDGKKDLFSQSRAGSAIEVYRNTSEGVDISFEFMKFDLPLGDFLQFPSGGGFTNMYVSSIDIPSIVDYDKDGDLDVLTFEPNGSYMYLYQNRTVEEGLPQDTLAFILADACWGKFFESGVSESISLSTNVANCSSGLQNNNDDGGVRHAGSTVLTLDGDGDGDFDMLLGDLSNTGLVYLENNPEGGRDFITKQDTEFPKNSLEVDINVFLSPFFIDVDNDGKRDLVVSPNIEIGADNINHVWYYNNVGTDEAPIFEFVTENFFVSESLQMGQSSSPTFFDYNADGLMDILVGNNGLVDGEERIVTLFLYENTGTASQPSYTLVDDNYLDMREYVGDSEGFLAPSVGDIDGDGDVDILVGEKKGFMFFFENIAGPGKVFEHNSFTYQYKGIRSGLNTKPAIADVDEDGLMDLVIGEKNDNTNPITGKFGSLNFYKNIGTENEPDFVENATDGENTNTLGNVFTRFAGTTSGNSAPFFFKSKEELLLCVGSRDGKIGVYNNIKDSIYGTFNLLIEELPIEFSGVTSVPSLADIDNDNYYEIMVGGDSGGLMIFNTTFEVDNEVSTVNFDTIDFDLFPNPVNEVLNIQLPNDGQEMLYQLSDINGQVIKKGAFTKQSNQISTTEMSSGIYILSIQNKNSFSIKKFMKI